MGKHDLTPGSCLLAFPLLVLAMVAATLYNAGVISLLWGWIAIPVFHLPSITLPQAVLVSTLIGALTHQYDPNGYEWNAKDIATAVLRPAFILLIGWIAHMFC